MHGFQVGPMGGAVHPDAVKYALRALTADRCPEVRSAAAAAAAAVAQASSNFRTAALEMLLLPCARSLDDPSPGNIAKKPLVAS